jgi:polyhydroxybutyrate depolymerase
MVPATAFALALTYGCSPPPEIGQADYSALDLPSRCAPGTRNGAAGASDGRRTPSGIRYNVRTPRNYDPALAHPLLILYAPGGFGPKSSERFSNLTTAATSAGFIVTYAEHRPLAMSTFSLMGELPGLIARDWCVDGHRIVLAGHSDGASTAGAIAFLRAADPPPAAVVLSAAGIRGQDLRRYSCPPPLSVMVLHSRKDELFPLPDYGEGAFAWWASCNHCAMPAIKDQERCTSAQGCAAGAQVRYCETSTAHTEWPPLNAAILEFLEDAVPLH